MRLEVFCAPCTNNEPFYMPMTIVSDEAHQPKYIERTSELEEYKVIQRLKDGDIGSLEVLVNRYQEKAIRTAYLITQDKAVARDVVQATFIQVYKSIHRVDASRPFAPYFFRSVAYEAVRASKKSKRTISLEDVHEDTGYLDELISTAENPETVLEEQELREKIQTMLAQLSPEQRSVIVLKYYLGYSEQEMAQHLNTAKGTIKSRFYKARQHLKRLFQMNKPIPLQREDLT